METQKIGIWLLVVFLLTVGGLIIAYFASPSFKCKIKKLFDKGSGCPCDAGDAIASCDNCTYTLDDNNNCVASGCNSDDLIFNNNACTPLDGNIFDIGLDLECAQSNASIRALKCPLLQNLPEASDLADPSLFLCNYSQDCIQPLATILKNVPDTCPLLGINNEQKESIIDVAPSLNEDYCL